MTLPPLIQHALQQIHQEQLVQSQAAVRAVEKQVGQALNATVTEVTTLTETERRQALDRLHQQLATGGPAARQALQQLKAWAEQPQLHLVGLKAGGSQHFTITPEVLKLNQMVEVLIRADGQLQLQPATSQHLLAEAGSTGALNRQTQIQAQLLHIASALRASLPHQKPVAVLVELLAKLDGDLLALPAQQRDATLPPAVRAALQNLHRLIPAPTDLTQPARLQQAVRQSGAQLEASLAKSVASAATHAATPPPKLSAAQILANLQNTLARQSRATTADDSTRPLQENDTKAALLYALKVLQNHQVGPAQPVPNKPSAASDSLVLSLFNLLQRTPPREKGFVNLRNQLLQSLQHQVAAALAKVQTQQLQSLSQKLGDGTAPTGGGYVEIPVRLPDGYSSIGIHFQEYWSRERDDGPEREKESKNSDTKVRQWEVLLEFDLGRGGELAAQLKVTQNSISARIWAEKSATLKLAEAQLANLRKEMENSGLEVRDMRCLQGLPPQKQVKFNYNLVDIRT